MKNKRYAIDVDGVIRNLYHQMKQFDDVEDLEERWVPRLPQNLWDDIDVRPKFYLYDAPIYKSMLLFIRKELGLENCIFLTNQCNIAIREFWTKKFIDLYFGDQKVIFVGNFKEKIDFLLNNEDYILFDDYPKFYEKEGFDLVKDRIYLVARKWNNEHRHNFNNILELND